MSRNFLRVRFYCLTLATLTASFCCAINDAYAQNLGQAQAYNIFVIGNDSAFQTDSQGQVAVGGNATFTQYTSGSALPASSPTSSLVVGGTLTNTKSVVNGNVFATTIVDTTSTINGNVSGNAVNLSGGGNVNGNVSYYSTDSNGNVTISGTTTKLPALPVFSVSNTVNFATTQTTLDNESTACNTPSKAPVNGTVSDPYGTITCTGTSKTQNVFDITGAQMSSAYGLNINVPQGSTVIINVSGVSDTMQNFQLNLNGEPNSDVIYNFYQATSLTITGISVQGTVLAPYATTNFYNASIYGTLISNNLTDGNLNTNQDGGEGDGGYAGGGDLFAGVLPNGGQVSIVPEPSSDVTLAFGLLAMGGLVIARRKKNFVTI